MDVMKRYLEVIRKNPSMRVKKFANTSSFAPSSWLGVTENDEPIRISYRVGELTVVVGDVPLEGYRESETIIDKDVETDGSQSRLSSREMTQILREEGIDITVENEARITDDDIGRIQDDMSEYLDDIEVE